MGCNPTFANLPDVTEPAGSCGAPKHYAACPPPSAFATLRLMPISWNEIPDNAIRFSRNQLELMLNAVAYNLKRLAGILEMQTA